MLKDNGTPTVQAVIGDWRLPLFDPMVGQSVFLELQALSSGNRNAAEGVAVLFKVAEQQPTVRVVTNGEGWARFAYKAEQAGDIEVIATLDIVNDGAREASSHTFRFTALDAEVWDDARIQLNAEPTVSVWGEGTLFPRTSAPHTVKLAVTRLNSHLLGREISLGLTGDSSMIELGITKVEPALGAARKLTEEGLSWTFTGGPGGAYALALRASRILRQSPVNRMSLGGTPLPEVLSKPLPEGDGSVASSGTDPITG
ncbi:hypothetical protein ACYZT7_07695 [Pseudomonas sp. RT4P38]